MVGSSSARDVTRACRGPTQSRKRRSEGDMRDSSGKLLHGQDGTPHPHAPVLGPGGISTLAQPLPGTKQAFPALKLECRNTGLAGRSKRAQRVEERGPTVRTHLLHRGPPRTAPASQSERDTTLAWGRLRWAKGLGRTADDIIRHQVTAIRYFRQP